MLTQEYVRGLFDYRDGKLFWKVRKATHTIIGNEAGHLKRSDNYTTISIDRKHYTVHRLVFLYHHGYLPEFVDHIDGDRTNNCIENLRECTREGNNRNAKKRKDNTSGHKSVFWARDRNKWRVIVGVGGVYKRFGQYDDYELACLVADEVRNKYHGEFARHF